MKYSLVTILIVLAITASFVVPNEVFGCSLAFDTSMFLPYTTYLHGDCTEDIGHLNWTGLVMIMLAVSFVIIAVKKLLQLSRKSYLLIIPAVFACILLYSVIIYETADLTEFFLPRDYLGNLDHGSIAHQLALRDFKEMLAQRNAQYNSENMFVTFNRDEYSREQYRTGDFELPYAYCGIVALDDRTEYWYSAVYDGKRLLDSQIHETNPKTCDRQDETCFCQVTKIIRDNFKFRPLE